MFVANSYLLWMLFATFVALCIGTAVRIVALRGADPELVKKRLGSLRVWWVLAVLMAVSVTFGVTGTSVLLAIGGWLGLREYLQLIGLKKIGRLAVGAAYVSVVIQYLLIATQHLWAAQQIFPVAVLLVICALRSVTGNTTEYIRSTCSVFAGVMLLVYSMSHAALLYSLPVDELPLVGLPGWFLFLVILTEMNDITQALVGRRVGKHRMTPQVSPNKTWEGFVGGLITTVVLAVSLSPYLTTLGGASGWTAKGTQLAATAGVLISIAGFLGDINMSAIKRDVGVKDGSQILPGMGGIIDRVDSLTFTAPVFYYFVQLTLSQ